MAEKRMFSKQIIDSDAFLDMPQTTQLLYFHLAMRGDDDGFINNPKSIMRNAKCGDDDLKLLNAKKFIIPFETGIVVIKHWKIHNYIAKDRYKETKYKQEKSTLALDENNSYTLNENILYTDCIQNDNEMDTQIRLDKIRLEENSIDKDKKEKRKKETDFDILIKEYTTNEELKINIYEFIKMRKGIKATITTIGLKRILSKLDTLASNDKDKIQILDNSIANSWRGIFELKEDKRNYGTTKQDNKPTKNKTITGEGEELARRAQELYGDTLQDFECEY